MAAPQVRIRGLLPDEFSERVVAACHTANASLGLSERLLQSPLPITLKQGYRTPDIDLCLNQLQAYFAGHGGFAAMTECVTVINGMLWLELSAEPSLSRVHSNLDTLLNSQFDVPEQAYDEDFRPHVTLFQGEDEECLDTMAHALEGAFEREIIGIDRIRIEIDGQPDQVLTLA